MKKYNITVNGTAYEVCVEEVGATASAPVFVQAPAQAPAQTPAAPAQAPAAAPVAAGANAVSAPMPGTILEVKVSVGQSIKKGDVVCVLEAMKMENEIPASADGVVKSVNVQKGASVNAGDALITIG
jgi:biotin carboxyl carrier protein